MEATKRVHLLDLAKYLDARVGDEVGASVQNLVIIFDLVARPARTAADVWNHRFAP
jgi:hypothetical protein